MNGIHCKVKGDVTEWRSLKRICQRLEHSVHKSRYTSPVYNAAKCEGTCSALTVAGSIGSHTAQCATLIAPYAGSSPSHTPGTRIVVAAPGLKQVPFGTLPFILSSPRD